MANRLRQPAPLRRTAQVAASGLLTTTWFLMQSLVALPPALAQAEEEDDQLTYGEFLELVDSGQVEQVDIDPNTGRAQVRLEGDSGDAPPQEVILFESDGRNPELIQRLREQDVDVEIQPQGGGQCLCLDCHQYAGDHAVVVWSAAHFAAHCQQCRRGNEFWSIAGTLPDGGQNRRAV